MRTALTSARFALATLALTVSLSAAPPNIAYAALPWAVDGTPLPSLAPMVERVQPGVVNLSTRARRRQNPLRRDPFFRRFFDMPQSAPNSLGSGVIVDAENGYVITNHHLIEDAEQITVTTHDGRTLDADLVGSDAESDIAVLAVAEARLDAIALGDSAQLRVGDFVVAIGNPFGLTRTVTSGIVSALGRSGLGIEGYEDFIQTDASINPGNSGGALVDLHGRLVGINTAIFSRGGGSVGIGFAIPINMVKTLMAQLVEHGDVRRGLLGVMMQDLTPTLAEAFGLSGKKGAVVSRVLPQSAAARAGIREGDVIVRFDRAIVEDGVDLRNAVGLLRAGQNAEVEFYRDGKRATVTAKITEGAVIDAAQRFGARFAGARFKRALPSSQHRGGIEVVSVEADSAAARAGLADGDVIVGVNRKRVATFAEMERAIDGKRALLLELIRDERALLLVMR